MTHTITESDTGCWVAGSAHNTADEISAATIELAADFGMPVDDDLVTIIQELDGWCDEPDDAQWLHDVACYSAIDYLSSLCPEGYYFTFDDGLMMYGPEDEDDY